MYFFRLLLPLVLLAPAGLMLTLGTPSQLRAASVCSAADAAKDNSIKIAAYTQCLEENRSNQETYGKLLSARGDTYRHMKKYSVAREDYHEALAHGASAGVIERRLGWMSYYEKDYPTSVTHYRKALEADPDDTWTVQDLGDSLCRIEGQYNQALAQYDKAINLNPQKQSTILYWKGRCQQRHKYYKESIESFTTAIYNGPPSVPAEQFADFNGYWDTNDKDDPRSKKIRTSDQERLSNLYKYRSQSFTKLGDHKNAFLDIDAASDTNKTSSIYNSIAWMLATCSDHRIRDGKRAIKFALWATEKNNNTGYRDTLAAAYAEAGQFEQAVATQQEVIKALKEKGETDLQGFEGRLSLYQQNIPYRVYASNENVTVQQPAAHREPALGSYYMPEGESFPQHWEWLIDHQYEKVGKGSYRAPGELGFNEAGFAQAMDENGYWGLIDRHGKFVYRSEESRYAASAGDLGVVRKASRGNAVYVDFNGKQLIEEEFFFGDDFFKSNNNVTWVTTDKRSYDIRGTERLINLAGETLLTMDQATEHHGPISEGFTALTTGDELCGYYNSEGKAITPRKYKRCVPFKNGRALVEKVDGSLAHISPDGKEVRPAERLKANRQWGFSIDDPFGHERRKKPKSYLTQQEEVDIDAFKDLFSSSGSIIIKGMAYDRQGNLYAGKQFAAAEVNYYDLPAPDKLTSIKELRILPVKKLSSSQPERQGVIDIYGRVHIPAQFERVVGFTQLKNETGDDDLIAVIRHKDKSGFIRLLNNFEKTIVEVPPAKDAIEPASVGTSASSLTLPMPEFNADAEEPTSYPALAFTLLQQAEHDYQLWRQQGGPERFQRALFNIESALTIEPEKSELWFFQGLLLSELKGDAAIGEQALTSALKAVQLNPEHGRAQVLLAQLLFNQGRFEHAVKQIHYLFAKDAGLQNAQLISLLAASYIAADQANKGSRYFLGKVISLPDSAPAKLALAILFKDQGKLEVAKKTLKSLLDQPDISQENKDYARSLLNQWQQEGI